MIKKHIEIKLNIPELIYLRPFAETPVDLAWKLVATPHRDGLGIGTFGRINHVLPGILHHRTVMLEQNHVQNVIRYAVQLPELDAVKSASLRTRLPFARNPLEVAPAKNVQHVTGIFRLPHKTTPIHS